MSEGGRGIEFAKVKSKNPELSHIKFFLELSVEK